MRHLPLLPLAPLIFLVPPVGPNEVGRPDLDAGRLQTGIFRYRDVVAGKGEGESRIEIVRLPGSGNYRFSNVVEGAFVQSWETVASPDFSPVSAKLTFGHGADAGTSFELRYRDGRVTGVAFPRKAQEAEGPRTVDEPVFADSVDQRIDWAAVMAFKQYIPGEKFEFHVYDPGTGNSRVVAEIGGTQITAVPAGSFESIRVVYTIEKNRGTESYEVFISKSVPRFQIRENFPNGVVSELLERTPR